MGQFGGAEAVGEHPPGQQSRQPGPAIVDQLACCAADFERVPLPRGFGVGDTAVTQVVGELVLGQGTVLGQYLHKSRNRVSFAATPTTLGETLCNHSNVIHSQRPLGGSPDLY